MQRLPHDRKIGPFDKRSVVIPVGATTIHVPQSPTTETIHDAMAVESQGHTSIPPKGIRHRTTGIDGTEPTPTGVKERRRHHDGYLQQKG